MSRQLTDHQHFQERFGYPNVFMVGDVKQSYTGSARPGRSFLWINMKNIPGRADRTK